VSIVVIDTNVLASGFVRSHSDAPPVQVLDAWRDRAYTLAVSEHILTELTRTLNERYFRARLTVEEIAADLALLRADATIAPITVEVRGVATHPEDDLVLATAVSAQADYLVTGDTKLQRLGSYQGVTIVSPREFLDVLTGP
jgi:putative PIN family toxin of toxin-antitoxin system